LDLLLKLLLLEYSWAKQVDETRVLLPLKPSFRGAGLSQSGNLAVIASRFPGAEQFIGRRENADPLAFSKEKTRKSRALQCPKA
jgi:hypothetical protein